MSAERSEPLDPRLIESEARYQAVIENASDMIQSVLPDGTFEFVNRAWRETLGYTEDEVGRLTLWDIIHPESYEHCAIAFQQVMEGQHLDKFTATFAAKDGRPVPVEGSVTTRAIDGRIIATHGFFRDITERLRAEELRARNEQLERERLARSLEKMAALGKLAAGLAHELNNPAAAAQRSSAEIIGSLNRRDAAAAELISLGLSGEAWQSLTERLVMDREHPATRASEDPIAISEREEALEDWLAIHGVEEGWRLAPVLCAAGLDDAAIGLLAQQMPDEALGPALRLIVETLALRDAAEIVSRSASRMSDLVSAVKAYSYMDRAVEQVVDVHEGIDNTRIILAHRLKHMKVVEVYDRTLPRVRAFGSGLNQVWTNLIDNAADAMNGAGQLTIRTALERGALLVEVIDTGPGIPPEVQTRLFEPFFTTKRSTSGTGLGLNISYNIIRKHHGDITVASRPGQTRFIVCIPVGEAARESDQPGGYGARLT